MSKEKEKIPAVRVEGVSKKFGKKTVLQEISFGIDRGDLFGFLGPNGAGKTTTMRIILGLLEPTGGTAEVFGLPFGKARKIRKKTGVMLEGHGLYETMTLRKNIEYYARLFGVSSPEEHALKVIETVRLSGRADEKVGTFSTGMKKKAALARALVNDPDILFLDEPTSGLDPEAQVEFRGIVKELSEKRGVTVFFNSHNLDEVQRICNKAAIISEGKIRVCDTVQRLRERYGEPSATITLASEEDARRLADILGADERIGRCEAEGKNLRCTLAADTFTLKDLLSTGVEIEEFSKNVRTLEDVYLEIVRRAEGEE